MKSAIARDLGTRYESALVLQLVDKCSILDPRFKATYIADRELTEFELQAKVIHLSATSNAQCDPVSPSASDFCHLHWGCSSSKEQESKKSR